VWIESMVTGGMGFRKDHGRLVGRGGKVAVPVKVGGKYIVGCGAQGGTKSA